MDREETGCLAFSAAAAVVVLLFLGFGGWWWNINVYQPAHRQTIDNDAQNQILQENWFRQEYAAIKSYQTQLDNARAQKATFEKVHPDLGNLNYNDQQEYQRINTVIQGLSNQQVSAINDYNAASDNPDKEKWRGTDLPKHIDVPVAH